MHLAEAEASLVLVESLMLVMVERGIISSDQLVEAVEAAIAAKKSLAKEGISPQIATIAAGTLSRIANTLAAVPAPK